MTSSHSIPWGPDYVRYINTPDPKPKPFVFPSSPVACALEKLLLHTQWWFPLAWIPIALVWGAQHAEKSELEHDVPVAWSLLFMALGVVAWQGMEVTLHTVLFHMEWWFTPTTPVWLQRIHFVLHGMHHKWPLDTRLVTMPPEVAASVSYCIQRYVQHPHMVSVYIGILLGYAVYDVLHALSHIHRKRIGVDHMVHHFQADDHALWITGAAGVRANVLKHYGAAVAKTLKRSTRKNKKWQVTSPDGKTVHFGDATMQDYTAHKNTARRSNYCARSSGIVTNGKFSPNALSRKVLWDCGGRQLASKSRTKKNQTPKRRTSKPKPKPRRRR